MNTKVMLLILDGFGFRKEDHGNAVLKARMPKYMSLYNKYPHSLLEASGELVGLPEGQMGNSEVGHMNLGAGRVVYQPLMLINKEIKENKFKSNIVLNDVINHVNENDSKLHIMGLLSDGGVHSHIDHIIEMIDMASLKGVKKLYIHAFTDGRDTHFNISDKFIKEIQEKLNEVNLGKIASISGRFYSMDRDNKWDRTKKAYDIIVNGNGNVHDDPLLFIESEFQKEIYDEFLTPTLFDSNGIVEDNDGIMFANFRTDRATQLLSAITNNEFDAFDTKKLKNIKLGALMKCNEKVIHSEAFKLEKLENTLGDYLSKNNLTQLRIAETEKYAHVTYFFDGGVDKEIEGCKRILINSPKVRTYDLKPEMSAKEVKSKVLKEMGKHDFILLNFANPDMVGHTGNMVAAIKALEKLDKYVYQIYKKAKNENIVLLITADHGNVEEMLDDNNKVLTSHTTNKVPFIVCSNDYQLIDGKLSDVAPTILKIMNQKIPKEMNKDTLI